MAAGIRSQLATDAVDVPAKPARSLRPPDKRETARRRRRESRRADSGIRRPDAPADGLVHVRARHRTVCSSALSRRGIDVPTAHSRIRCVASTRRQAKSYPPPAPSNRGAQRRPSTAYRTRTEPGLRTYTARPSPRRMWAGRRISIHAFFSCVRAARPDSDRKAKRDPGPHSGGAGRRRRLNLPHQPAYMKRE
ncbi:hypothetical protein DCS_02146 [Drechmeria coniospora]|uniref:Uncharacterized protein n=1 Tax=Drechmeria coniospora TaxID=98403 RepID=A0A151GV67_DRECN|nr:hypothetical protein DCS_02146 [Drechmeria coniospora]KYK61006.1 hypothetical protein DCS_02146 [Drechmeria coniospora]